MHAQHDFDHDDEVGTRANCCPDATALPPETQSSLILTLPDHILRKILAHAPFFSLNTLRATCRKFNSIVLSDTFDSARAVEGSIESTLVVVARDHMWLLSCGRWHQAPWAQERGDQNATMAVTSANGDQILQLGNHYAASILRLADGKRLELPYLLERRRSPAVCYVNNCIFVAGGFNTALDGYLSSAEMFDPESNVRKFLPSMPHPTYGAVAGLIDTKVYVAGGANGDGGWRILSCLQVYDTASGSWELGPPMPESIDMMSCVTLDKRLYIVGRARNHIVCVYFCPEAEVWQCTAPISVINNSFVSNTAHYVAATYKGQLLAILANKRFVFRSSESSSTFALRLESNEEWSKVPLSDIPELPVDIDVKGVCSSVVLG